MNLDTIDELIQEFEDEYPDKIARYTSNGTARETLGFVEWLVLKLEARDATIYKLKLDCHGYRSEIETRDKKIQEIEAIKSNIDETITGYESAHEEITEKFARVKDRINKAPVATLKREELLGALMPEPESDGEYISYAMVELTIELATNINEEV